VLESGHVDIIKDHQIVARLGPGRSFGEVALINDVQRTATVRASTLCRAWVLDRSSLRSLMHSEENNARSSKVAFLKTVTMFEKLGDSALGQIADVMKYTSFVTDDKIIKQGEVSWIFINSTWC
jgi:CRP-like cAMP-binding protein